MHRNGLLQPGALRPFAWMLALGVGIAPVHAAKYTYHGELMDGDVTAEGAYDLRVRSFANPDASKALGEATELPGVVLVEGRFSVELDLPEDADGITWVDVAVRRAGSGDAFETLGDPQPLAKVNSTCPGAWALDGNSGLPSGSFLGTVDPAEALEIQAGGRRVARFQRAGGTYGDAPHVALGSSANIAGGGVYPGATVAGGGSTHNFDGTPCSDCMNRARGGFSSVGGGRSNLASGERSTIAGGSGNRATGYDSTVSGGTGNEARGDSSHASGSNNVAAGIGSQVSGGASCAGGHYSWAGGLRAKVRAPAPTTKRDGKIFGDACDGFEAADGDGDEGSFVWADNQGPDFVSTGPNQVAIRAAGGLRWGGTGVNSTTSPAFTHQVDTAAGGGNTCTGGSGVADSRTAIDHPLLNGNPDAVIVMTPNYGSTLNGVAPPRNPLGVYFNIGADGNCAAGRWVIYDVTTSPATLNNGAKFNIWFVLP